MIRAPEELQKERNSCPALRWWSSPFISTKYTFVAFTSAHSKVWYNGLILSAGFYNGWITCPLFICVPLPHFVHTYPYNTFLISQLVHFDTKHWTVFLLVQSPTYKQYTWLGSPGCRSFSFICTQLSDLYRETKSVWNEWFAINWRQTRKVLIPN